MTSERENSFMRRALELAEEAARAGEVPVGAVAVTGDAIIAEAYNQVEAGNSALAHAEMLVLERAAEERGDWRMEDVTVYVTKEPCAMCAGAMVNSRVRKVVYGMHDPRSGCCGSALDICSFEGMLWQVQVEGGVLEEEAKEMMRLFFRKVRSRRSGDKAGKREDELQY